MNCPHCGREHELHSGPTRDALPEPGDLSICWSCHKLAVYLLLDGHLALRLPTAEEEVEIKDSPQVRETLAAMAESYYPEQASELRWGSP